MHRTLTKISSRLTELINHLESNIPNNDPFGNAHGNWSFPGLTKLELIKETQSIIDAISSNPTDEIAENGDLLSDYLRRLDHLRDQTIPQLWSNANQAVPSYLITLQGLKNALHPIISPSPPTSEEIKETSRKIKSLKTQLRGMDARFNDINISSANIIEMVKTIEGAYEAADQLPADLEALSEAKAVIDEIKTSSEERFKSIESLLDSTKSLSEQIDSSAKNAEAVLARCESAYSAATSVGLAAAFTERSTTLSRSMWAWVGGLVAALGIAGWLGAERIRSLADLAEAPSASGASLALNLVLSILSIGAPVWFAWLATKQIGQRFRLSEDYAFKASVSRAYEGYRREAARLDADMESRLLASALSRLDELPLRLVDNESHGSPFHEFANSDIVRRAYDVVPEFTDRVKGLAAEVLNVRSNTPTKRDSGQQVSDN